MIGAQASNDQLEKILSYVDIGKKEGAKLLTGGERLVLNGELSEGYYMEPTVFEGHNKMRIFQEEIFGPVVSVTTVRRRGRGALDRQRHAVWLRRRRVDSRHQSRLSHWPWIQAGRVWTNCYHLYPAHAAFGGYKQVRHRAREPQDDARPLSADQESAGELQPEGDGLLLVRPRAPLPILPQIRRGAWPFCRDLRGAVRLRRMAER